MKQIRGLAIFKANGEPWTLDELGQVCIFTGDLKGRSNTKFNPYDKYIADTGIKGDYFMHFRSKEDLSFMSVDTLRRVEFNDLSKVEREYRGITLRVTGSECKDAMKSVLKGREALSEKFWRDSYTTIEHLMMARNVSDGRREMEVEGTATKDFSGKFKGSIPDIAVFDEFKYTIPPPKVTEDLPSWAKVRPFVEV